jgi:hypothetical protein
VGSQDFLVLPHPVTLISILRVHVSLIDAPGDVDRDGGVSALYRTWSLQKQTVIGVGVNPHLG